MQLGQFAKSLGDGRPLKLLDRLLHDFRSAAKDKDSRLF